MTTLHRVYAVANPSVIYRRLSVTFVTLLSWLKFPQCFYAILYHILPLTAMQTFTEIAAGQPLRRELNGRGVAKYSDVGHVEGSETASGTIND